MSGPELREDGSFCKSRAPWLSAGVLGRRVDDTPCAPGFCFFVGRTRAVPAFWLRPHPWLVQGGVPVFRPLMQHFGETWRCFSVVAFEMVSSCPWWSGALWSPSPEEETCTRKFVLPPASAGTRGDEGAYWRTVARYCIDRGVQAVLDEYVHHLAAESGANTTTDEGDRTAGL